MDRRARPAPPARAGLGRVGVLLGGWLGSPTGLRTRPGGNGSSPASSSTTPFADGRLADASHLRDRAHAAVPQQPRLDRQRQALLALVQMRQQDRHRYGHARIPHQQTPKTENGTLFPASFSGSGTAARRRRAAPPRLPPSGPGGIGDHQLNPGQPTGDQVTGTPSSRRRPRWSTPPPRGSPGSRRRYRRPPPHRHGSLPLREVAASPELGDLELQRADSGVQRRPRSPLRWLTRSGLRSPNPAPHRASASAPISACTNPSTISGNRSVSAASRCLRSQPPGPSSMRPPCLLHMFRQEPREDDAVVLIVAGPRTAQGSYTTSVDANNTALRRRRISPGEPQP